MITPHTHTALPNGILGCHFWKKWHYFDLWHSNGIMAFLWHFRDFLKIF